MPKEISPATREKVVKSDRPFYAKKCDRPFYTKKSDTADATLRERALHYKKAIALSI